MDGAPRHESLEAAFRAAVPPPAVPRRTRLLWLLLLQALRLRPLQRIIERKYGP